MGFFSGSNSQTIRQLTRATSQTRYGSIVKSYDRYNWPMNVNLQSSNQGVTASVDLSYQRQNLNLITQLSTDSQSSQSGEGTIYRVDGTVKEGPASQNSNMTFSNSRGESYSRQVSVNQNQILNDITGGNMQVSK